MELMLLGIGFLGGFISGLLGIGGAMVLIPLMLQLPPLLGTEALSIHQVSTIAMLQVLASSALGVVLHGRAGHIQSASVAALAVPLGFCALTGAIVSRYLHADTLLLLFGILVVIAIVVLPGAEPVELSHWSESPRPRRLQSAVLGGSVGLVSGIVGTGGGFILVPLLVKWFKFPVKIAVGTSLCVVFIGALLGSLGKIMALQVSWSMVLPVLAGSLPAVWLGAWACRRLSARLVRRLFVTLLLVIALNTWADILFSAG